MSYPFHSQAHTQPQATPHPFSVSAPAYQGFSAYPGASPMFSSGANPHARPFDPSARSTNFEVSSPTTSFETVDVTKLRPDSYAARRYHQFPSTAKIFEIRKIDEPSQKDVKNEFREVCNFDPHWRERTLWVTSYDFHLMKEPELMVLIPAVCGIAPQAANMRPNTHDAYVVFSNAEEALRAQQLLVRRVQIIRYDEKILAFDYGIPGAAPNDVSAQELGLADGQPMRMPRRPLHVEAVNRNTHQPPPIQHAYSYPMAAKHFNPPAMTMATHEPAENDMHVPGNLAELGLFTRTPTTSEPTLPIPSTILSIQNSNNNSNTTSERQSEAQPSWEQSCWRVSSQPSRWQSVPLEEDPTTVPTEIDNDSARLVNDVANGVLCDEAA